MIKPDPRDWASRWRPPPGPRGTCGILRSKNSRNIGGSPSRSGTFNCPLPATARSGIFCRVLILTTAGEACSTSSVKSGRLACATSACPINNNQQGAQYHRLQSRITGRMTTTPAHRQTGKEKTEQGTYNHQRLAQGQLLCQHPSREQTQQGQQIDQQGTSYQQIFAHTYDHGITHLKAQIGQCTDITAPTTCTKLIEQSLAATGLDRTTGTGALAQGLHPDRTSL